MALPWEMDWGEAPATDGSSGRGSWYSQFQGTHSWVDPEDRPGSNALGVPDWQQGIALPSRATLGQWFDVDFPNGQTHRLQQTDVGPAGWTGRGIDISAAAAERAGYSPRDFPTNAPFRWRPAPGASDETMQPTQVAGGKKPWEMDWQAPQVTPQAPAQAPAQAPTPAPAPAPQTPAPRAAPKQPWEVDWAGGEVPAEEPTAAAPAVEPTGRPSEFVAGFKGAIFGSTPKVVGGAMEAGGIIAGNQWLQDTGQSVQGYGEEQLKQFEPSVPSYTDIPGEGVLDTLGRAGTYAAYAAGQALGTSAPSLAAGVPVAMLTANPIIGIAAGAALPSYIQNWGDAFTSAKEDKDLKELLKSGELSPYQLAVTSAVAGIPMAALDAIGAGKVLGTAFQEAKRGAVKSLGRAIAKGALTEGGTEGIQEAISQWSRDYLGAHPELKDRVDAIVNNVLGGAIGGAMFGAGGRLVAGGERKAPGPVPTADKSIEELVNLPGEKQPGPVDPEAALEQTKPGDVPIPPPAAPSISVPEGGEIRLEEEQAPGPIFYSQLVKMAEEKLPGAASPQQILATLRQQPGVKEVEIQETGLENFLQSREGKFTKQEVMEYLEENQIEVQESFNTKYYPGNFAMIRDTSGVEVMVSDAGRLKWEKFVAPGPTQSYTEFRLVLKGKEGTLPYQDPHWADEPNVVGHVQGTTRIDKAGNLVFHIEGLQGQWQQSGRALGYLTKDESKEIFRIRGEQAKVGEQITAVDRQVKEIEATWGRSTQAQAFANNARMKQLKEQREALMMSYRDHNRRVDKIRNVVIEDPGLDQTKVQTKPPHSPFQSNWVDLLTKRMYRWAADNGYSKISWSSPELAILWNTGADGDPTHATPKTKQFLTELYGKIIPRKMKDIARRYNGVVGVTEIETGVGPPSHEILEVGTRFAVKDIRTESMSFHPSRTEAEGYVREIGGTLEPGPPTTQVYHVTVPETSRTMIQRGMTLYDQVLDPSGPAVTDVTRRRFRGVGISPEFRAATGKIVEAMNEFAKKFGFAAKVDIRVVETQEARIGGRRIREARGVVWKKPDGRYEITLFANKFLGNIGAFYATAMHELGHVVVWEKFDALPDNTKQLIREEFRRWREANLKSGSIENTLTSKRPAALWWLMQFTGEPISGQVRKNWSLKSQNYHLGVDEGFHEYMADQVARWAATTAEPLTIVEKAWAGIGKALRFFQEWMASKFGVETRASLTVQNWLNSFLNAAPISEQEYLKADIRSQAQNQYYVGVDANDPNVSMPPQQPNVAPIRATVSAATGGSPPTSAKVAAAHADRISWVYEWFGSILDLAQRNPNFTPLLRYIEKARDKDRVEKDLHDAALRIAKDWRGLGHNMEEKLAEFLDELTNMTYLTPDEQRRGIVRHPTAGEIRVLAARTGVNDRALAVAVRVRKFTEGILDLTSDLARRDAMRILDPVKQVQEIDKINAVVRNMKAKPYFPFMRFGRHYVMVKNPNGVTLYFETFERKGLVSAQRQQQRKLEEMRRLHPGDNVTADMLPKTAEPFIGLPPNMLDLIKDKLSLTPAQLDALKQLQFQLSPSMSFRHHFQHKKYIPGYSRDFLRAFSKYAFHAGRYYAKTLYVDGMRQDITAARAVGGNLAARIADFMSDHLQNAILDVKGDYGTLKGLMFLWAMGYSPASATLNMTQTPMVTFPFLATHFGSIKASRKLATVMGRLSNFYKRGSYEGMPDWQMRALGYGIRTGRIVETQAPELAGMSQGGIFRFSSAGNAVQRGANQVMEKSAWLFEMAEQWNRRIAFRAAMQLAYENPTARINADAFKRYPGEFAELTGKWGFSEAEARAILTAGHIVDRTQFVYAGWARPRFMRGRLAGSIFIFKRYLQSLLFLAGSDYKFFLRYAMMAALMGGLGGIPGAEDLKNLVQAMLRWLGFNADVEKQIRTYIKDYTDDAIIPGDVVLHGLARRGFGVPAALDALGSIFTGRPGRGLDIRKPAQNISVPVLDRSKAVTPGPIIPEAVWKLMDPSKEVGESLGGASSQVLGYGFSAAVNMFKAIADPHLAATDWKRWEKAEPRALASLSKMYRALTEADPDRPGFTRERSGGRQSGTTVTRYDIRDPEQLMEVLALGLGYNDLRRANEWDRIIHQNEHTKYIDIKRKGLLEAYEEARLSSPQEFDKVKEKIIEFNEGLADEDRGKAITPKTLQQSVRTRTRERVSREGNVPVQRGNRPIAQEYERIYPRTIEMIPR